MSAGLLEGLIAGFLGGSAINIVLAIREKNWHSALGWSVSVFVCILLICEGPHHDQPPLCWISLHAMPGASEFGAMNTGATFSPCRQYRYTLFRQWDENIPPLAFLMLNPSTADETTNDPTVERCQRRAQAAGAGGVIVVNIFALRSTDPQALYGHENPIGQDNNRSIIKATKDLGSVICAWGTHGAHLGRGREVLAMLRANGVKPLALKINADGSPAHPLYLPYSLKPVEMPA